MKKEIAVATFGSVTKLARALGVTPQAISQWAERLDTGKADRVIGASIRLGVKLNHAESSQIS